MEPKWKEYFELWGKSAEFADNIARAREEIEKAGERSYVAYSGGKDSIVLLHLAASVNPKVQVFHFIAGKYLIPERLEQQVIGNISKIAPLARPWFARFNLGDREASRTSYTREWYRAFYSSLKQFKKESSCNAGLIGLRSEESARRKRKLQFDGGSGDFYPLKSFSWKDVWAYIVTRGLPYPWTYDRYADLLGWDKARFVTFFDSEFDKLGSGNIDNLLMWREKH